MRSFITSRLGSLLLCSITSIFLLLYMFSAGPSSIGSSETFFERKPSSRCYSHRDRTYIYVLTPTYARDTQHADLVRLGQSLQLVPDLFWIIIEDDTGPSEQLSAFLKLKFAGRLCYFHLAVRGKDLPKVVKKNSFDSKPKDQKAVPKGMLQRNKGLQFIRRVFAEEPGLDPSRALLYYADDDNAYDVDIFEYMRTIKTFGFWGVGFVGGGQLERPLVNSSGKIFDWHSMWDGGKHRKYRVDMASFAMNMKLLIEHPNAAWNATGEAGMSETKYLEQFRFDLGQAQHFGIDEKRVFVWHVRTMPGHEPTKTNSHERGWYV